MCRTVDRNRLWRILWDLTPFVSGHARCFLPCDVRRASRERRWTDSYRLPSTDYERLQTRRHTHSRPGLFRLFRTPAHLVPLAFTCMYRTVCHNVSSTFKCSAVITTARKQTLPERTRHSTGRASSRACACSARRGMRDKKVTCVECVWLSLLSLKCVDLT